MRNSTYIRMFIAMALIVFISFSLLGALSTIFSYRRTMSERRQMMSRALSETARYVETQQLSRNTEIDNINFSIPLTMISRVTDFDVLLTDTQGVVIASSNQSFNNLENTIPADILHMFDSAERVVYLSTLGHLYLIPQQIMGMPLAMSIGGEIRVYGYLIITSDISVSGQEWRSFSSVFIMLALCVMALAFVIVFFASKKQAEPLNEIAVAARRFARGEFDIRVNTGSDRSDEIGQLAEAFNFMADSLQNNEQLRRDFIANLSHELKTPMTVIAGFAEGLLDGTIRREDEARYLKIISSETRRLSRMVRSMLDVTVLGETTSESLQQGSFDITEVVRLSLLSLSSKLEEKRLSVEADLPEDPVIARGNSDSVTQVVYNLIDNAIKYSKPDSPVKLAIWHSSERIFVSVTNYGDTIPESELPNIFQRFHKVDKSRSLDREGVGLGLYIVKAILDKLGEDIFITSANGETKFIFTLTGA